MYEATSPVQHMIPNHLMNAMGNFSAVESFIGHNFPADMEALLIQVREILEAMHVASVTGRKSSRSTFVGKTKRLRKLHFVDAPVSASGELDSI